MKFQSDTLNAIWPEIENLSDENRPFCRKEYSVRMPCCDLTPYVADMLSNNDIGALGELWELLGAPIHLLSIALKAEFPDGFSISDYARREILAAYLLMHRCGETWPGICVVATTLSTRDFSLSESCKTLLMKLVCNEIKEERKLNPDLNMAEELEATRNAISIGVTECGHFAELMKRIPPMVRVSLSYKLAASDFDHYGQRLHFDNGYGERCYGCSEPLGWSYAEALDILELVEGKDGDVLAKMTKDELLGALRERNMNVSPSMKKGQLVELARAFPEIGGVGLARHKAELVFRLKPEYEAEGKAWAMRDRDLRYLAAGLLAAMGSAGWRGR